ncbi:hypothetical protein V5F79_01185 [Xanthobacter flavus]|uniref:hypothetical protein n=1 Tax=Xanthobacter flavus TaxID=281 RepID=UPI00372A7799
MQIAIEDVRAKHTALFELIRFTDQQAMALLGLYTTIAVAAAAGFGASLGPNRLIPLSAGVAMLVAAAFLVVGAACCFRVIRSATISTPGREAEFWVWATTTPTIGGAAVLSAYLRQADDMMEKNRIVNESGTAWLRRARGFGMAAPLLAVMGALVAVKAGW